MFSVDIVDTDKFLDMPASTQALYFHLGMRADDDGFVTSPKRILRMSGCNDDDLRLLIAKNFIIPFESGVVVITDWKVNNYLRPDRYTPSRRIEEKKNLTEINGKYQISLAGTPHGIPEVNQCVTGVDTQKRIEENRIEKNRRDKGEYQQIADMYNNTCVSFPRLNKLSENRKKAIKARLKTYTLEDFQKLFEMAESSAFLKGQNNRNWSATFDWLIKDSNMAKVLDGNYQDKQQEKEGTYNGQTEESGCSIKLWK